MEIPSWFITLFVILGIIIALSALLVILSRRVAGYEAALSVLGLSISFPNLSGILAGVGVLVAAFVGLFAAFSTPTGGPPVEDGDRIPAFAAVRLLQPDGTGWVVSISYPERTPFSQGSTISASVAAGSDHVCLPGLDCLASSDIPQEFITDRTLPTDVVKAGYCLELLASSFEVAQPQAAPCGRALNQVVRDDWSWSLYPKDGVVGTQQVAVALAIDDDEGNGLLRYAVIVPIEVEKGPIDRYPTIVVGIVGLVSAVLA